MEKIQLKVADGTEMQAHAARPAGVPSKGIIVLQEVFGVTPFIERVAERFANQGYLAVAPEIFHRTAPPGTVIAYSDYASVAPHREHLTDADQLADITACFDWLVAEGVPADKIVVLGFCAGGRNAFLANASLPLAAAVSFYGGGIAQSLLDRAKDLHAPQFLIWAGKDAHILPEHRKAVADALTAAGKPFVEKTYPETDHAFARDDGDHYDAAAAKDAWELVDTFLASHLL